MLKGEKWWKNVTNSKKCLKNLYGDKSKNVKKYIKQEVKKF